MWKPIIYVLQRKLKYFEGNYETIMKRSQLKNKVNKTKDAKDILKHQKQRNYVVWLNQTINLRRSILIVYTLS